MIGCISAGNFIYDGALKTYNQIVSNFTIYGTLIAFDVALDPIYHLADINYSCFMGGQEAYTRLLKYVKFTTDPMTLVWNLVYNLGLLYDAVKDVVTFFIYPARTSAKTVHDLAR